MSSPTASSHPARGTSPPASRGRRASLGSKEPPKSGNPSAGNGSGDDEYMDVRGKGPDGVLATIVSFVFTFSMVHYLLWFPLTIAGFYFGFKWLQVPTGYALAISALCLAAYVPYFLTPYHLKGGRPWDALRMSWLWQYAHRYLSLRLIRTGKLDPAKQYIFGFHPHGVLVMSRIGMYGGLFEKLFPGIDLRTLGATPMFWWPGAREISLWMGAVDAGRKSAEKVLSRGNSLVIYPGGSREIFSTDPYSKETVVELNSRKGFIRLALRHGAALVPTVIYNERHAYTPVHLPAWLRGFCLRRFKMPMLLFFGRFGTLMPLPFHLGIVFGKPIEVLRSTEPTEEEINELHARYKQALLALWEEHKTKFGYTEQDVLVVR